MSLSKRLKASEEARDMNSQYILPLIPPRPLFGVANTGTYVDTESAIRTSTVYACVRLLGDTISSLPMGCLLYTSPSPRDRQKSRMPSSA